MTRRVSFGGDFTDIHLHLRLRIADYFKANHCQNASIHSLLLSRVVFILRKCMYMSLLSQLAIVGFVVAVVKKSCPLPDSDRRWHSWDTFTFPFDLLQRGQLPAHDGESYDR